jgi:hypothetical protein
VGVYATAAAYLTARNKSSATEGDLYYDTTLDVLRTYDGTSWSAAGQSGVGPGSLDAAANIGVKITIDSAFTSGIEIEATDAIIGTNGQLLLLDNNDTGSDVHSLEIDQTSTAAAIQITNTTATTDDIQGTSDTWAITGQGAAAFASVTLGDDNAINIGASTDAVLQWDQTRLALTAAADSVLRIGAAGFSYDVEFIGQTATTNLMKWDLDGGADSLGALVFDNADLDLGDADLIRIGDGQDVTIQWDQTNLLIEAATDDTGQIRIGSTNAIDLSIYGSTATNIALWDVSASILEINGWDINLQDDDILQFGDAPDLTMTWDQTKFVVACDDGRVDLGVSGGGFDMYWYTEDATNYIYWDEDNSRMDLVDVDLRLDDDARLYFGSDADAYCVWDNANSTIDVVGNISITGTLSISGAFDIGNFAFADDEELRFGNSNDFVFHYDSSAANLLIDAAAANDIVDVGSSVNTDWIFHGGTATYDAHWDASANTLAFLDDAKLGFGNTAASPDMVISWDQTRLNITGSGKQIRFGADDEGVDVLFYGETASAQVLWDESADQLVVAGGAQITLNDSVELLLGTGTANAGDFSIASDGTDLLVKEIAATGKAVKLGVSDKGLDLNLYGETAGYDLLWDQSADSLIFKDSAVLALGTGSDVTILWDQTNLLIEAATQDTGIIKIGATNALDFNIYGNTATSYASFDSGAAELILEGYDLGLQDSDILQFGNSNDITIQWDETNNDLLIDGANANTAIMIGKTNNQDVIIYGDATTDAITIDTSAEDIDINGFDLSINDDDLIKFGDADDITITWDQTNLLVEGVAADMKILVGKTNNIDLVIYGDTSTDAVTWDTSAEDVQFNGFDLTLQDDDILNFGDADDVQIFWDQTQLQIDGGSIFIGDQTTYVTINATGDITCALNTTTFSSLVLPTHATSSPDGSKSGTTGALFYEQDASVLWVCASGTTWLSTAALS